jgi:hypothetical protein
MSKKYYDMEMLNDDIRFDKSFAYMKSHGAGWAIIRYNWKDIDKEECYMILENNRDTFCDTYRNREHIIVVPYRLGKSVYQALTEMITHFTIERINESIKLDVDPDKKFALMLNTGIGWIILCSKHIECHIFRKEYVKIPYNLAKEIYDAIIAMIP